MREYKRTSHPSNIVRGLWLCLWELWHSVINTTQQVVLITECHNSHKHSQRSREIIDSKYPWRTWLYSESFDYLQPYLVIRHPPWSLAVCATSRQTSWATFWACSAVRHNTFSTLPFWNKQLNNDFHWQQFFFCQ